MRKQRGITLIALIITVVILVILTFSFTVNMTQYDDHKTKANFKTDIVSLKEEIDQYYSKNKIIPTLNKYTTEKEKEVINNIPEKNPNDNDAYYVLDIGKLGLEELNYGKDYFKIKEKGLEEDISSYLDVYIINKGSKTIYYPKGIEYAGEKYYSSEKVYSKIDLKTWATVAFSGEEIQEGEMINFNAIVKHISYIDIDAINCKWVINTTEEKIGTEEEKYTNNFQAAEETINIQLTTPIEIPEDSDYVNYYLHILTVDIDENKEETVSAPVTIQEKKHVHTGDEVNGGGCYTKPVYHVHDDSCYEEGEIEETCEITSTSKTLTYSANYYELLKIKKDCTACGGWNYVRAQVKTQKHSSCGKGTTTYAKFSCTAHSSWSDTSGTDYGSTGSTHTYTTTGLILICDKIEGETIEKYELGCGLTEEQVDGYIISY